MAKAGCKDIEKGRVAYLGAEGSFSHLAALRLLREGEVLMPVRSLYDVMANWESVQAVVAPFENSTTGLIRPIVDTLLSQNIWIEAVHKARVDHHLVSLANGVNKTVEGGTSALQETDASNARLYVQREAYDQCRAFLRSRRELPIYTESTSDALESLMRDGGGSSLAVVNGHQLRQQGDALRRIAAHIEDHGCNHTRFARIVRVQEGDELEGGELEGGAAQGRCWLLRADLHHRPGALAALLKALADAAIDLLALHSRPIPELPGRYRFVLELQALRVVDKHWLEGILAPAECLAVQWLGAW